jgi:rhodanese-related sulfurtransferase
MNTPLRSLLVASLGLCVSLCGAENKVAAPAKVAQEIKAKHVSVEEFTRLRTDTNSVVVDVRTEKEFKAGHIPGAINIDVNAPDFDARVAKLDRNKTYLMHCVVGHRSELACGRLIAAGLTNVLDFHSGLKAWKEAGHSVEVSSVPAATTSAQEIKMRRVEVEEFARLRANTNNIVLDVRTEREFKAGHIPGAIHIDVNAPDFEAQVGKLGTNRTFLVHCAAGVRSRRACGRLDAAGFQNLIDLAPGFNGWEKAGLPVEK